MLSIYILYIILLSIITFIMFYIDKKKAINNKRRIKESTLLFLSFIGGAIGAYFSRILYRHKTKKIYFSIIIYTFILIHILIFILIYRCF